MWTYNYVLYDFSAFEKRMLVEFNDFKQLLRVLLQRVHIVFVPFSYSLLRLKVSQQFFQLVLDLSHGLAPLDYKNLVFNLVTTS